MDKIKATNILKKNENTNIVEVNLEPDIFLIPTWLERWYNNFKGSFKWTLIIRSSYYLQEIGLNLKKI